MNTSENTLKSLKLIARSSLVVLFGISFSKFFTYIYRIIIARQFGPEEYGLFSLSLMISGWFTVIFGLGLSFGILRYLPIYREEKDLSKSSTLIKHSFCFATLAGILGGALMFFISKPLSIIVFHDLSLVPFLKIFSLSVPLGVVLSILLSTIRSYELIGKHVFLSDFLNSGLNVSILVLLLFIGCNELAIPSSYVISLFLTLVVAQRIIKHNFPKLLLTQTTRSYSIIKEVIQYSWPLFLAGFLWKVFNWVDSFFIGYFSSSAEVGIYNAAIPIAALLTISLQIFMQLFFPLVNREYSLGNKEKVKQLSQQVGKWIFFLNIPVLAILLLYPGAIIKILFGAEYLQAQGSLRVLGIGTAFYSLFGVSERLIRMTGASKSIFRASIFAVFIDIALNFVLVPKWGIYGAAISTSFSLILLGVLFAKKAFGLVSILPIRRKMVNLTLAGVVSSSILVLVNSFVGDQGIIGLILIGSGFFLLYTLLVFLFKGFDQNDLSILGSMIRKVSPKTPTHLK